MATLRSEGSSFSSFSSSSSCHSALLSFLLIYQTSSFPCCHIWYRWLGSMEWPVSLHLAASVWQQDRWLVKGPRLSQHTDTDISQRGSRACFPPSLKKEMRNLKLTQSPATGYESQGWMEEGEWKKGRKRRRSSWDSILKRSENVRVYTHKHEYDAEKGWACNVCASPKTCW